MLVLEYMCCSTVVGLECKDGVVLVRNVKRDSILDHSCFCHSSLFDVSGILKSKGLFTSQYDYLYLELRMCC